MAQVGIGVFSSSSTLSVNSIAEKQASSIVVRKTGMVLCVTTICVIMLNRLIRMPMMAIILNDSRFSLKITDWQRSRSSCRTK